MISSLIFSFCFFSSDTFSFRFFSGYSFGFCLFSCYTFRFRLLCRNTFRFRLLCRNTFRFCFRCSGSTLSSCLFFRNSLCFSLLGGYSFSLVVFRRGCNGGLLGVRGFGFGALSCIGIRSNFCCLWVLWTWQRWWSQRDNMYD